jgi:hypothetical protein
MGEMASSRNEPMKTNSSSGSRWAYASNVVIRPSIGHRSQLVAIMYFALYAFLAQM